VQNSGDANGYLYVRGDQDIMQYCMKELFMEWHLLGVFLFYNDHIYKEVEFDKSSSNSKYGTFKFNNFINTNKKYLHNLRFKGNVGLLASQATLSIPIVKSGITLSGRKTYIDGIIAPTLKSGSKIMMFKI
jgi:predicted patatin/cPLA2 family phospholipase